MRSIRLIALLALFALTLGFAVTPAQALPDITPGPLRQCGITQYGIGTTNTLALADALDRLRDRMFISSYTVVYRGCVEIGIEPNTTTSCLVNVTACGVLVPRF
jgi:hypothetical protein